MVFEVGWDLAFFYGIMLGGGCLSLVNGKKKFITITGSLRDDKPFFINFIHPILKKLRGKDTSLKIREGYGSIEYNFVDVKLFDFLHDLGFPIGKKGNSLFLPEIFAKSGLISQVVAGFFATGGSLVLTKNPNKYYPRLEAQVISKGLLREIYDHLISIGLKGSFYRAKRLKKDFFSVAQRYRFQFNGLENLRIFEKEIGFINPKHSFKKSKFMDYSEEYINKLKIIPTRKQFGYRKMLNSKFELALEGIEPSISAS